MSSHHGAFSPSLTLAGMDYIAPSAACIKPSLISSGGLVGPAASTGGVVGTRRGGNADAAQHADVVKISLQDCLACSGCVTTAETVLVNAQSRDEIVSALQKSVSSSSETASGCASRPRLVSISSQTCASLAAYLHMSMASVYELIAGFARATLSTSALQCAARDAEDAAAGSPRSVMGNEEEVRGASQVASMDSTPTTLPESEPQIYVIDLEWAERISAELTAEEYNRRLRHSGSAGVGPLPLIVSSCPGWVCYCEKQGSALLPHLCPVLSAQGIAGSYAKHIVSPEMYHISLQPCFDRKLEAARDVMTSTITDLTTDAMDTPIYFTDCVLSTAELLEWMRDVDPSLPWRGQLDTDLITTAGFPEDYTMRRQDEHIYDEEMVASPSPAVAAPSSASAREAARLAGSGGYHQLAIAHRLRAEGVGSLLLSAPSPLNGSSDIVYEVKRNRNHHVATCAALPNEVFCVGYGFQQVQNVVRGLRRGTPAMRGYTFIELMACPEGCLNGGGQVRLTQQPHSKLLDAVMDAYEKNMRERRETGDPVAAAAAFLPSSLPGCVFACPSHEDGCKQEGCHGDDAFNTAQRGDASPSPPPHQRTNTPGRPFAYATIAARAPSLGDALWHCTFRDREKEFTEMLNDGNVHSLKW